MYLHRITKQKVHQILSAKMGEDVGNYSFSNGTVYVKKKNYCIQKAKQVSDIVPRNVL